MKKRVTAILAAAALACVSLAACGGSSAPATTAAPAATTEAAAETAAAADTTAAAADTTAADTTAAAAEADGPEVNVTFCNMLAPDHPQSIAAETVLKKEIAEKTGGKFTIDVQVNGALGSDAETVEATVMGTMNMTGPSCATLATIDPKWYVLDLPYVFMTKEQARNAFDGELGQYLSDSLEETAGLICLAIGESGMRNLSNSTRPIEKPEDMAGLKLRVMENKYHLATFEAFGASPTPMAFAEVYTALQTKQIDGQDNPITITCTSKFYEVQKYYSLIEDLFCGNCVVVNAAWFHSLPESYQTALREAAHDMIVEQRRLIDENEAGYIEEMEAGGCAVNELTAEQKQVFADATQSVRDMFVEEFGEEGTKMLELAEKYK